MSAFRARLADVKERAEEAARRGGFAPPTLVAVTKYATQEEVAEAIACGITDIGENYPQALQARMQALASLPHPPRVHLIGSLQSNKVKLVVGKACLIHSLDRLSLARAIDTYSQNIGMDTQVLLEINSGKEVAKGGVFPEDAHALLEQIKLFPHLRVMGLMTMAPKTATPEESRPYFRATRKLFETIKANGLFDTPAPVLSMGMSHSFEIAAEEGATMIRVGQALFGHAKP